jgi:carbon-monoxide dehydrogenase medium subunit
MSVTEYLRPDSLAEACRLKTANPDAIFIAGGMDLMVQIRTRIVNPPALISLRNISELRGIEPGKITRIGSMTTISEILAHQRLGKIYPALHDAARPFASMQIRNLATIGGNLCNASPCADFAPVLLVLDARICIEGTDGQREISLEDFFIGPGETCLSPDEVLTSIVLEKPAPGAKATYLRKSRVRMDLALASVAVLLEMDGDTCSHARVAAGAVAPRPIRLRTVEAALESHRIDKDLLARARALAEQDVAPITDVRSSADYRRKMIGVLFKRAVESILDGRGDER